MAWATRKALLLTCALVLVAFGDARLRDRKSRPRVLGEDVKATTEVRPPTNFQVETLSNTSIAATWSYDDPTTSGFLLSSCRENETHCFNNTVSGYVREYTFEHLAPATKYAISVSALMYFEESEPVVAYATTYANAPNVTGLKLEVLGNSSIEVSWNPPEQPVSRYEIVTCPVVPGHPCVDATARHKSSYIIENLKPGTEYEVTVHSVIQKRGYTSYGVPAEARATTECWVPPVSNLELSCPADGVIVAEWTLKDPLLVDTINIVACPLASSDCRKAAVGPRDKSVEFKGLLADEQYTVNATTLFTVGDTTFYGESVIATIVTQPKPPSTVVNLMHEISNVTTLNASWEKPADRASNVTGYFLSCEKDGGHEIIRKEVPARSQRVTTFLNLKEPLTKFECSVWAYVVYNETKINGTSENFGVETESPAPSEVAHLRFSVLNVTTLNASWDRPSEAPWGISSYVVGCKSADTNVTVNVTFADEEEYVIKLVDLHEQLTRFGCSVFAYVQVGGETYEGNETTFDVKTLGIEAPKNVELVNRTATSLTFEWDADPKAPNYTIEVAPKDGVDVDSWTESVDEEGNGTVVHDVIGLKPWTLYEVSIRNCAEYCGKEVVLEQQTRVAAPSSVLNLKSSMEGYTNVTLSWTKPANPNGPIDGYTVKLVDTERNQTFVHDLNTTSVTLNVVYKFTDFEATVTPYNMDDNTTLHGPSRVVAFSSSGDGPVPPRPHVKDVKDHSVLLTWETPKDKNYTIVGYEVTVNPGGKNVSTNSTNVTLSDLEAWTQYSVLVASCTNSTKCGTPKAATFRTDVDAPSAPQNLTVHSFGTHWVDVAWKAPQHPNGPLSGYNVTLKNGSELVWATTRDTSHNITGLEPGTSYEISVYAFNKAEKGEKKGPVASFSAQTQSEVSGGGGVSGGTIAAAVLIPLLVIALVVGFFVYKKYARNRGESQSLLSGEGS